MVYEGPFEGVLACEESLTGKELARHLGPPAKRTGGRRKKPVDRATDGTIKVRKASLHNLRDVDVELPAGEMTVVCGPSGSGKTSLAFDTLFAEGQRRFVECLSTYARQFLGRVDRPPVEEIEGLAAGGEDLEVGAVGQEGAHGAGGAVGWRGRGDRGPARGLDLGAGPGRGRLLAHRHPLRLHT